MNVKFKSVWSFLLLLIAFSTIATKAIAAQPRLTISIDGKLNDAAWKKGRSIEAFKTLKNEKPLAATTGMMLTDANYLYLAFRCQEPQMEKLQATPVPRDGAMWSNDCIEIFVDPFKQANTYYHLAIDATGHIYDALNRNGKEETQYDLSIIAKTQRQKDSWTLEIAIPLADLGLSNARSALMNFCRERKPVIENTSWHGGFGDPATWQTVPLSLGANRDLDVSDWDFGNPLPQYGDNKFGIKLTSSKIAPLKVLLYTQEKQQWKLVTAKSIHSTALHINSVSFPYFLSAQNHPQALRCEIENNNQIVFRSTYKLNLPANALVATLSVPYYYAEENYGYLQLDNFVSAASLQSSSVELTVQNPKGKVLSTQKIHPLRKSVIAEFDISQWREGSGWVTAKLVSDGKMLAVQRLQVIKRPGPFTKSTFGDATSIGYNAPLMMIALNAPLITVPATTAPYSCVFTENGWNPEDWVFANRTDMKSLDEWTQGDDYIQNNGTTSDTFTSMLYRKKWRGDFTISTDMLFTDRMAPAVELAWNLGTDAQGLPEYREVVEVVLWDHGINIWRLHLTHDKHVYVKAAYYQFTLQKNTKYNLQVTRKGKTISVNVDGYTFGYEEDSLPDELYAGITACEGTNRLYNFSIK